jgi:hypothetical protein
MARVCNAMIKLLQLCILFFRTLDCAPAGVVPENLAFHVARSGALIASVRQRTNCDTGKEINKTAVLDVPLTRARGWAVVVVNLAGQASAQIDRVVIGTGINSAHLDLEDKARMALRLLNVSEGDRQTLSSPVLEAIVHEPREGDIAKFRLCSERGELSLDTYESLKAHLVAGAQALEANGRHELAKCLQTMQGGLLFLLYWSVLGAPRCPDLFYISRLSHASGASKAVRDDSGDVVSVFSACAVSPRAVLVYNGMSKTRRETVGATDCQVSLLDAFTSHHLALFCFLTNVVREALGQDLNPSRFSSIWSFKRVEELRAAFISGSTKYLQVGIGVEDARQAKAQIVAEDSRVLEGALDSELRVRESGSSLGVTGSRLYIPVKFGHSFTRHQTNYKSSSLCQSSQFKLDDTWRNYIGALMCIVPSSTPNPHSRSLISATMVEQEVFRDISTKILKGRPLRDAQRAALSHFLKGYDTAVLAPVGCGKSILFLAAGYLAGRRGQFVLVLSPMRSIALNAQAACSEAGLIGVIYTQSTASDISFQMRTRAGLPDAHAPFDVLIVSFESWMQDSSFSELLYDARCRNLIGALIFDEW